MKTEITFNQLYWNQSLMDFFFRDQAENTLDELLDKAKDRQNAIESIEAYCEANDVELDDLEESFYNDSVEELAEMFCIELDEEEDEDE